VLIAKLYGGNNGNVDVPVIPGSAAIKGDHGPHPHFAAPAGLKAPPLSFATRVGDLLFVSASPALTKGRLADGFEGPFGFVVRNITRVLGEAGAGFRDLVKVNVLLTRASMSPR